MGSGRPDGGSAKERLKWTQELHELFERSVNQLGGPDRATPKGILRAMGVKGLTIFHVKSHLQKYRMLKFIPESSNRGKYEKRSVSEILPNFSVTSGAQLNEALQLYKQVQMRLNDQNEVQRSLKTKIEAQGRYLDRIKDENRVSKTVKLNSPTCLPSLCDEEESEEDEEEEFEGAAKRRKKAEVSKNSENESSFSWSTALSACQSPFILPSLFNSFIN
ncbi:myb family transcription factor PHL7-like [Impatiens glandulifera]|uniref:myb family transcription factor PHL7-like n=1 Tax=Impatiens glandulifera TaxID=253017 RepID=UPI001FB151D2|nr:myb family transcription factor PHL7-like [Impatiens glandulifera]